MSATMNVWFSGVGGDMETIAVPPQSRIRDVFLASKNPADQKAVESGLPSGKSITLNSEPARLDTVVSADAIVMVVADVSGA